MTAGDTQHEGERRSFIILSGGAAGVEKSSLAPRHPPALRTTPYLL